MFPCCSVLNRVLEPSILLEMTLSDGSIKTFEVGVWSSNSPWCGMWWPVSLQVPVSRFHELRYNVAFVLKEMEDLEKRSILKLEWGGCSYVCVWTCFDYILCVKIDYDLNFISRIMWLVNLNNTWWHHYYHLSSRWASCFYSPSSTSASSWWNPLANVPYAICATKSWCCFLVARQPML